MFNDYVIVALVAVKLYASTSYKPELLTSKFVIYMYIRYKKLGVKSSYLALPLFGWCK